MGVTVESRTAIDVDALTANIDAQQAEAVKRNDEISASALLNMQFAPVEYVVPGVFSTGLTLLVAAPKIGKSWMALDLAYQVATGGRAFGALAVEPRPVLYMALEDGRRRLNTRMKRLECKPTDDLSFITLSTDIDADIDDFMSVHAHEHPLIIVDTLQKYRETKPAKRTEFAYERDYAIVGGLQRRVLDADGSVLMLHHDRKATSGDFVESVSGTNGIAGSADTIMTIRRARTEHDAVLSVTSRDAIEGEYAVTFDDGRWTLGGSTLEEAAAAVVSARAHQRNSDRSNDVLDIVNRHPQGVRPYQVAEILTDLSPKDASTYLKRLANREQIRNIARGVYAPIV